MCNLNCDINNTPKTILQGWKTQSEIDIGDIIGYYVKSYQVKLTKDKCTKVQLTKLNFSWSQK